ncbi:MAG TPA: BTAD domain-containing putative transcriptional regulator [Actinomycetes bacterium]|nr:BTAD domain-containing putative transcriptional regulator [Actinomycetes bacterium]
MEFRLLGPLEVCDRGRKVTIGGPKVRALLAVLLLRANRPVGTEQLIEALWDERPTGSARQALHFVVHRLRRALAGRGLDGPGGSGLVTTDGGYELQVGPDELDVDRFEQLVATAREKLAAGRREEASGLLSTALGTWRGSALADLLTVPFAQAAAARLEQRRVAVQCERFEIELDLGRHTQLLPELEKVVRSETLEERLWAALVLALYRSGRQAEALGACRSATAALMEELGVEPGPRLKELERAVLNQDAALDLSGSSKPDGEPAKAAGRPPGDAGAEASPSPAPEHAASRRAGQAAPEPGATREPWPLQERKVVTSLFATWREEDGRHLDPEDARVRNQATQARLTGIIEHHGGIARPSVDGTVRALFGVPTASDDDPERAVRAGLALCTPPRTAGGEPADRLDVRVGIETGQAVIGAPMAQDAGPQAVVDGVTGLIVDQAATLAGAAPAGTVVVGAGTERTTRRVIDYLPLGDATGSGWEVLRPHSRTGGTALSPNRSTLVERTFELSLLESLFTRVRREHELQLVTIAGPPGIGKSRLVSELAQKVDAEGELVYWRQGRSLPHGQGVTFWALAQVVKAHAGILEDDPAGIVEIKLLRAAADALGANDEATWAIRHLRPLVQPGEQPGEPPAERHEAFAAWRGFLEALASKRPMVLVLEDLHWADDALLEFVDELVDQAAGVPLLVVCAARPELLERRPSWSGGKTNATTISLAPLSPSGTTDLLRELLHGATVSLATQVALVARAGGNPLFVEEYVRMLGDQGLLPGRAGSPDLAELSSLPVPESVQHLITARLDALDPADKALLADAAVFGEVGWVAALAAISGRDPGEVGQWLHRMERRDLLRQARATSVAGETEYTFRHGLVRDVAYGQLARAARAERHERAAAWFHALGADRSEDRAELLAHHWRQALTLTKASGQSHAELADRARGALRESADRAMALKSYKRAIRFYRDALDLWPEGCPERGELLLELGRARMVADNDGEAELEAARDVLLAAGRRARAAECEMLLNHLAWRNGRTADRTAHRDRALALIRDEEPSASKALVLAGIATELVLTDRGDALEIGRSALEISRELGLRALEARALGAIGLIKVHHHGDAGAVSDLELSVRILEELHVPEWVVVHRTNLAATRGRLGDLTGSFATLAAARAHAAKFESAVSPFLHRVLDTLHAKHLYLTGGWDEADEVIAETLPELTSTHHYLESWMRVCRGRISLARGDPAGAGEDAATALELARRVTDLQLLEPALAFHARVELARGRTAAAGELADELLARLRGRLLDHNLGIDLPWVLAGLGRPVAALDDAGPLPSPWLEAAQAFLAGDQRMAAERYAAIGTRPDEAQARLAAARTLAAAGRQAEADAELAAARAFCSSVGADDQVRLAEALPAVTG